MADQVAYTATKANQRFETRKVVCLTRPSAKSQKRVFVPFAGFDGQALAGSGALVFEGELLERR